jgi:two-component system chemotaxis sensor kinase CheA
MGTVELRLEALGDRLKVQIEDDGCGIDFRRVAELAISRGLLSPSDAAPESPQELARFILEPGFSTSPGLTKLAGRGMGLSVVREEVTRLNGEVAFPQRSSPGMAVELSVPISISTHHVVLVACGKHTFGIPSRAISRLCRVRRDEIECLEGGEVIRVTGQPVPLVKLADLVGLAGGAGSPACVSVVALRSVRESVGIVVDALLDEREAVIKDLGIPAGMAGMSNGAIAMEDGTVTIVLSPPALVQRFRQAGKPRALRVGETEAPKKPSTILVVDDSITTRSLERSILEAHGYHVEVAVDGAEALEKLREKPADLVITDILMPRMDGFQLLEQIKNDKQLARIPVIVVTSLDQRQEHERGIQLGADAYIVKQKFDQGELLSVVRQIL